MKANELRIGNLFQTIGGKERVCTLKELERIQRMPNLYKPIPLTKEWLLKFGFDETEIGFSINLRDDNGIGENLLIDIKFNEAEIKSYNYRFGSSGDYPMIFLSNIKHVHQLQNLFFSLTGEELTIDP